MLHTGQKVVIAYKYVTEYSLIWSDAGSGAYEDVSIWHPVDIEHGYFPLGDTANPSHKKPEIPSLTVSALEPDALAPPSGFAEVWDDSGTRADKDVRIMKMKAPKGYTCLGHVAVRGHSNKPDENQYRYIIIIWSMMYCVKSCK